VPESSFASLSLSGANFAGAQGADTAYYNPAKMLFLDSGTHWETGVLYIRLPEVGFKGTITGVPKDIKSWEETFYIPFFHYVDKKRNSPVRYGFSLVMPAGLTKRWDDPFAKLFSDEFTLRTGEFNPSISWKPADNFSIGLGVRLIYAEGRIRQEHPAGNFQLQLTGDALDAGFNVSLHLKGSEKFDFALAYRSKVTLGLEGDTQGRLAGAPFTTAASLDVIIPANLNFGINWNATTRTSFEFVYDKTYWSQYKNLDFNYENPAIETIFGAIKNKNWNNSSALRFGIKHKLNNRVTLMGGVGKDENPAPLETMSFELPDSEGKFFSLGLQYSPDKHTDINLGYLGLNKDDQIINPGISNYGITGSFTNIGGDLLILSLKKHF
jgi:long-chain fatty acid transport protein